MVFLGFAIVLGVCFVFLCVGDVVVWGVVCVNLL